MTSRSIMRRIAAMKGEPVPTFDKEAGKDKITVEDLAATIEKAYAEFIERGTRGDRHSDWEAAAILEKYTIRRKP